MALTHSLGFGLFFTETEFKSFFFLLLLLPNYPNAKRRNLNDGAAIGFIR